MKKQIMPQEIEVWYLIPALRKELARIFIETYGFSQKKAANVLGVTESAISQYFNSKRAKEIEFSKKEIAKIENSAEEIVKKPEKMLREIYNLCISLRESKIICDLHKNQDKSVPKNCNVCFR